MREASRDDQIRRKIFGHNLGKRGKFSGGGNWLADCEGGGIFLLNTLQILI
jgi:hypothetical protein